jgi:hypothetical protein
LLPPVLLGAVRAGVLTETTAEIAAALTLAAARRVVEADSFMRNGHYKGWLPTLFIGSLLQNKTVRAVGQIARCDSSQCGSYSYSCFLYARFSERN